MLLWCQLPNLNGLDDFAPFQEEFDYDWVFKKMNQNEFENFPILQGKSTHISRKEETLELFEYDLTVQSITFEDCLWWKRYLISLFSRWILFSCPPDSNYFWQKWPETSPWGRQKSVQSKRCSLNLIWWFWGQATLILALLHKKCNNLAADNLWRIFDWGTAFNPLHAITALICLLL